MTRESSPASPFSSFCRSFILPKIMETRPQSNDANDKAAAPHGWRRWLEVCLVFLVFFVHAAEPVPDVNEPHYLAKARHYWEPDWIEGDFFLESADAHLVFYWTFGWITQLVPLAAAAWIGRLVTWFLLAGAWHRLTTAVVPVRFASVLSAAVFVALTEWTDLAGEWVVGGIEAKGFAYLFVLLGLERAVRSRWNVAWVLLGAASAFHVLIGGWSVLALLLVWATSRDRAPLVAMLPGLVAGGALSLFGVVPAAALSYGQPADVIRQANYVYVFERLPHHLALLSQDWDRFFPMLLRHLAAIAAFAALVGVHMRFGSRELDRERQERLALLRNFVLAALTFTVCGLVIELALANRPAMAAGVLRYYWYRLGDFAVPLGVAMFAVRLAELSVQAGPRWTCWTLVALMAIPAWYLTQVTWQRLENPAPRTEQNNKVRDWNDWLDATAWIRDHTPEHAVFLTPRNNQSFKWRAERAEVVTYKDIPQDARGILEWRRRLDDVYRYTNEYGQRENRRSLGHHGTARVLELAQQYEADYVLTDTRRILGLPIAYLNGTYVVYRVP